LDAVSQLDVTDYLQSISAFRSDRKYLDAQIIRSGDKGDAVVYLGSPKNPFDLNIKSNDETGRIESISAAKIIHSFGSENYYTHDQFFNIRNLTERTPQNADGGIRHGVLTLDGIKYVVPPRTQSPRWEDIDAGFQIQAI
jgi:hypothetical protein